MEKTENLNGYLYENALKIIIATIFITVFLDFIIFDFVGADILGIKASKYVINIISEDTLKTLYFCTILELIFSFFAFVCAIFQFFKGFIKDNIKEIVLTQKYAILFLIIQIAYFLIILTFS